MPSLSAALPGRGAARRRRHELEFLPATLEILETPASSAGRAIGYTIIAFAVLALTWAWFGKVDIVAVAQGKVIPAGRTKIIQPLEIGVVRAIRVQDGAHVNAGDVLIELDPTTAAADSTRAKRDLGAMRLEAAVLRAELSGQDLEAAADAASGDAEPDLVRLHKRVGHAREQEHAAQLAALDQAISSHEAEVRTLRAEIEKLRRTLPLIRERTESLEILAGKGYAPKQRVLELRQDLVRTEGDLKSAQARRDQAEADLDGARRQREQSEAGYRGKLLGMLAEDGQKIGGLEQELRKADHREDQQRLVAPVSGTIQQLAVHTVGGVVTPAEALMVIVPDDAAMVIEVMIRNKDIGFVAVGQEAEVKFETFNFTKYGTLHGTVAGISRDASTDEKQGLVYAARVDLDAQSIEVNGRPVGLIPGLAATVEIKTGRRRVLEYLLAPMLRYRSEGLRER